ncbi:MAG: site-2 protease family protein [Pseudomonadota bacterium]
MPADLTLVQQIAIWALPVLFAITVHEASHGYVARAFGDPTADSQGRLTLNPLRHIDPVGTVIVPILLLVLGGFLFGWAKPVPVDMRRLRHPRRDMAIVAAAGPLSNLAMAIGWGLLLKLALGAGSEGLWLGLRYMAVAGILINVVLMVLNLLPLPPLDGGRVLAGLVPEPLARRIDRIEPYGFLILVALLATGLLGRILEWPVGFAQLGVLKLVGLAPAGA